MQNFWKFTPSDRHKHRPKTQYMYVSVYNTEFIGEVQ